MRLSRRAEYAMKAITALTRAGGQSMTIAEISSAREIPKKFLEHILLQIKAAGLLTSKAGPRGGYALAKAPETVSLADLLAAIEEPICRQLPVMEEGAGSMLIKAVDDIRSYTLSRLSQISIKALSEDSFLAHDMEALMYYI
jgi:Rrf2 family protein